MCAAGRTMSGRRGAGQRYSASCSGANQGPDRGPMANGAWRRQRRRAAGGAKGLKPSGTWWSSEAISQWPGPAGQMRGIVVHSARANQKAGMPVPDALICADLGGVPAALAHGPLRPDMTAVAGPQIRRQTRHSQSQSTKETYQRIPGPFVFHLP